MLIPGTLRPEVQGTTARDKNVFRTNLTGFFTDEGHLTMQHSYLAMSQVCDHFDRSDSTLCNLGLESGLWLFDVIGELLDYLLSTIQGSRYRSPNAKKK